MPRPFIKLDDEIRGAPIIIFFDGVIRCRIQEVETDIVDAVLIRQRDDLIDARDRLLRQRDRQTHLKIFLADHRQLLTQSIENRLTLLVDPRGVHDKFFTEKLLYMPSQFSYISRSDVPEVSDAPIVKNEYPTFGSFNNYQSLTDEILGVWKEILRRLPNARMIMRAKEFESDAMIDAAYRRFKKLGLNMNAILFKPATGDVMKDFQRIDIALSTYPRTDPAMTIDALYMGVPVISLYGGYFGAGRIERIGGSKRARLSRARNRIGAKC